MRKNGQILLYDDVGSNSSVVHFGAALVVVNPQDVRVLGAVGVALDWAALGASICRFNSDAASEERTRRYFNFTRVG